MLSTLTFTFLHASLENLFLYISLQHAGKNKEKFSQVSLFHSVHSYSFWPSRYEALTEFRDFFFYFFLIYFFFTLQNLEKSSHGVKLTTCRCVCKVFLAEKGNTRSELHKWGQ